MNDSFCISLAGFLFEICPVHRREMEGFFHRYLTFEPAPEQLMIRSADLEHEQRMCAQADAFFGFDKREFSLIELEKMAIHRKLGERLPQKQAFVMHGCALAADGQGIIFTAPSRGGKSTHAALWRECFGNRVVMINDDKPIVRWRDGAFEVSGSPWSGKHHLDNPVTVPLKTVAVLRQAPENRIEPLSERELLSNLTELVYRPYTGDGMTATLDLITALSGSVRGYELFCTPEKSAAMLAEKTLLR